MDINELEEQLQDLEFRKRAALQRIESSNDRIEKFKFAKQYFDILSEIEILTGQDLLK